MAGRLGFASLLAMWVWIDPEQPVRQGDLGAALMGVYLAYSFIVAVAVWSNWWAEHLLSRLTFAIDTVGYFGALYFTQGSQSDLISPFVAFYAFLIMSAVLRWDWRAGVGVAAVLGIGYLLVGLRMHSAGIEIDPIKLVRRVSFMGVLGLVVTWFAHERQLYLVRRFELRAVGGGGSLQHQLMNYAMTELEAGGMALAWSGTDEPVRRLHVAGGLGEGSMSLPGDFSVEDFAVRTTLFDTRKKRALSLGSGEEAGLRRDRLDSPLPVFPHLQEGLLVPLDGVSGRGVALFSGIPGMAVDHLLFGAAVGQELVRELDREEIEASARDAGNVRLRMNIARDLHDSVAQSLAGARFRLTAIKNNVKAGNDPLPELKAMSDSLGTEQSHIREVIEGLRKSEVIPGHRNLGMELSDLANALELHWGLDIAVESGGLTISLPAWLTYELRQVVREGVSNAARHGSAARVVLRIMSDEAGLDLHIEDDGTGFVDGPLATLPRSISERVTSLGGAVSLRTEPGVTCLAIHFPKGTLE